MSRFIQTSLSLVFASFLLTSHAQAETDPTQSHPSQPNTSQSAERSTVKPTEPQASRSTSNAVKKSNQPEVRKISERDRIILQFQLQRIIPAE